MFGMEIKRDWCWSCDFICQFVYDEGRNDWLCRRCRKGLLHWGQKTAEDVQLNNHATPMPAVFKSYRREHPRFSVQITFDYSQVGCGDEYGGIVANASEKGLLVYLPELIKQGTSLIIVIPFIKDSEFNAIRGMAKVVWGAPSAKVALGKHRYGLELQSFSKGSFDKFKLLLREVAEAHHCKEQ